jgi:hypothetical protein
VAGSDAGYAEVSYVEVRTLFLRVILSLVASVAAFSQTVVDPAKVRGLLQKYEPQANEQDCVATSSRQTGPGFSFRFRPDLCARAAEPVFGPGHRWAMLIRVTRKMAMPSIS